MHGDVDDSLEETGITVDAGLKDMLVVLSVLPLKELALLIRLWSRELGRERETIFPALIEEMLSHLGRRAHMKAILRRWFNKEFQTLHPKQAAERYIHYAHMNSKMLPLLIKEAQKARNAERMKRSRFDQSKKTREN
jgi:hypothetical protein